MTQDPHYESPRWAGNAPVAKAENTGVVAEAARSCYHHGSAFRRGRTGGSPFLV
jgi:hypothetical protein